MATISEHHHSLAFQDAVFAFQWHYRNAAKSAEDVNELAYAAAKRRYQQCGLAVADGASWESDYQLAGAVHARAARYSPAPAYAVNASAHLAARAYADTRQGYRRP